MSGEPAGDTVVAARGVVLRRGRIDDVDASAGTATVLLHGPAADASAGCARCARGLGCQALFGPPPRATSTICRLPATPAGRADHGIGCGIGCEVEVAVPDAGALALRAAALGFGMPTVALVLGSVLGERAAGIAAGGPDAALLATLGGLCGLSLGVLVSHRLLRRLAGTPGARPCTDALRIASVAATRPPAPTGSHVDDEPV